MFCAENDFFSLSKRTVFKRSECVFLTACNTPTYPRKTIFDVHRLRQKNRGVFCARTANRTNEANSRKSSQQIRNQRSSIKMPKTNQNCISYPHNDIKTWHCSELKTCEKSFFFICLFQICMICNPQFFRIFELSALQDSSHYEVSPLAQTFQKTSF